MSARPERLVDAVAFDLDGTLYDLEAIRGPMMLATFPRWRTLRVGRRVREELRGQHFVDGKAFVAAETTLCAERLERGPTTARADLDRVFGVDLCRVLKKRGPRAEARDVLDALVQQGVALAVISDRGHIPEKLAALGLADLPWGALIAADDVGAMKPDPRPFRACVDRLGIAPSRLLYVGDRDDVDGEGARRVGASFLPILPGVPEPLRAVLTAV